jgi:hypothetical protein
MADIVNKPKNTNSQNILEKQKFKVFCNKEIESVTKSFPIRKSQASQIQPSN